MTLFLGRYAELRTMLGLLDEVTEERAGRCVVLHGPAADGKTRLTGEFLRRARATALIYPAAEFDPDEQRAEFLRLAQAAPLPRAEIFADFLAPDWDTVFRLLAEATVTGDAKAAPQIVIIDNAHLLVAADPTFATALRRAWTAHLATKPILLILVGRSALNLPATTVEVAAFNPAQLARLLQLDAATALDVYLATGGHPDIVADWPMGAGVPTAIAEILPRTPSAFEVRAELQAARDRDLGAADRRVRQAMDATPSSRAELGRATGLAPATLDRALRALKEAGTIAIDRPLSERPSREARYRLADPYLGTWARIIPPAREDLARGRADLVVARVRDDWPAYRAPLLLGLVREAMNRLARAGELPGTTQVGGYWTRFDDIQIDLVGIDDVAQPAVTFVGGMRWDPSAPFDHYDLASLIAGRKNVPGATEKTPLVGVTRTGSVVGDGLAAVLGPTELLTAWPV